MVGPLADILSVFLDYLILRLDKARRLVLDFLSAEPDEYVVVFNSGKLLWGRKKIFISSNIWDSAPIEIVIKYLFPKTCNKIKHLNFSYKTFSTQGFNSIGQRKSINGK